MNKLETGTKVLFFDSSIADYSEGYITSHYVELIPNDDGKTKRANVTAYVITKLNGDMVTIHVDLVFAEENEFSPYTPDKIIAARLRKMDRAEIHNTLEYMKQMFENDYEI